MSPAVEFRHAAMVLCLLIPLAGCGEGRDELAAERCKGEERKALGAQAKLEFPTSTKAALADDPRTRGLSGKFPRS